VDDLTITERGAVMNPSPYDDNNNIKGLEIENQIVHYVPKVTEKFAKRLEDLQIYVCGLKEVRKEDLEQFPQLKDLSLAWNDLQWLEGDLFAFNPKLEVVSFDGNQKLKYIGANLLDSLSELWSANFLSAGCIYFNAFDPEGLEELKAELKTDCKDEPTKFKMPVERTTTTTTTTEPATVTTLAPSQVSESPTEASEYDKATIESASVMRSAPALSLLTLNFFLVFQPVTSRE
jgi:hypothetical protein